MTRKLKAGDIVRVTSDLSRAKTMFAGWHPDMLPYLGRLAVVAEHSIADSRHITVPLAPLECDRLLGILKPRPNQAGWWFDVELLELVEPADGP